MEISQLAVGVQGLVQAVGVSNYGPKQLERIHRSLSSPYLGSLFAPFVFYFTVDLAFGLYSIRQRDLRPGALD